MTHRCRLQWTPRIEPPRPSLIDEAQSITDARDNSTGHRHGRNPRSKPSAEAMTLRSTVRCQGRISWRDQPPASWRGAPNEISTWTLLVSGRSKGWCSSSHTEMGTPNHRRLR